MSTRATRRRFLQTTAAGGALLGLGDVAFLSQLNPVSAADALPADAQYPPLARQRSHIPRSCLDQSVDTADWLP